MCGTCPKLKTCPFANKIPNLAYDGDIQDVFNVLLAYGQLASRIDPNELQDIDKHLDQLWEQERKVANQKPGQELAETEAAEVGELSESMRLLRGYGLKFQSCMITLRTFDKLLTDLETGLESEQRLQASQPQTPGKKKVSIKVDFPLQKFDNAIREYEANVDGGHPQDGPTHRAPATRSGEGFVATRGQRPADLKERFGRSIQRNERDDSITGVKTEKRNELQRKLKEDWSPTPQIVEGDRLYKRPKDTKDSYMDKVRYATSKVVESHFLKKADINPDEVTKAFSKPRSSRQDARPTEASSRPKEGRVVPDADASDRYPPRRQSPRGKEYQQKSFSQGRYQGFESGDNRSEGFRSAPRRERSDQGYQRDDAKVRYSSQKPKSDREYFGQKSDKFNNRSDYSSRNDSNPNPNRGASKDRPQQRSRGNTRPNGPQST